MTRSLVTAAFTAAALIPSVLYAQDGKPAEAPKPLTEKQRVEIRRVGGDVESKVEEALRSSIKSEEMRAQILKSVREAMAQAQQAKEQAESARRTAEEVRREVKVEKTVKDGETRMRVFVNGEEVDPAEAGIQLELDGLPEGIAKVLRAHGHEGHGEHEHEVHHQLRMLHGGDGKALEGLKVLEDLPRILGKLQSAEGLDGIQVLRGEDIDIDFDIEDIEEHLAEIRAQFGKDDEFPFGGALRIEMDSDDLPGGAAGILKALRLGGPEGLKLDGDARAFTIQLDLDDEECCEDCDEEEHGQHAEKGAHVFRWHSDGEGHKLPQARAFAIRIGEDGEAEVIEGEDAEAFVLRGGAEHPPVARGLRVVRGSEAPQARGFAIRIGEDGEAEVLEGEEAKAFTIRGHAGHPQVIHRAHTLRRAEAPQARIVEIEAEAVDTKTRIQDLKAEIKALRAELKALKKSLKGGDEV